MSPLPYNETGDADGAKTLYVFLPGREPVIVQDDHPHYDEIKNRAMGPDADGEKIVELADASIGIGTRFEPVTDRISVAHGRVFFDGDEVHGAISQHILRGIESEGGPQGSLRYGVDWPRAEIAFLEKVQLNPSANSREQLYDWLDAHDFTITQEGDIVGYKGVRPYGGEDDFAYQSGSTGTAIVDGEIHEGHIPQNVGSTVTMPRSEVADNPSASCSTGLHVGTFSYAKQFASPMKNVLKVLVNPRDVVSVPNDASGEKVRVCRYVVAEDEVAEAETAPVLPDECPECGSREIEEPDEDDDVWCPHCEEYVAGPSA